MGRFSDIQKGKRARRVVAFPMPNTRCSLLAPLPELEAQRIADAAERGATKSGGDAPVAPAEPAALVAMIVLTGEEDDEVLAQARAHAVSRGIAEPKPGDPIFDLSVMVHTLRLGCVDPDSPQDSPVPFFMSAEQIWKNLSRDQIVHLHAQHEFFQDECSPRAKRFESENQFYAWVLKAAESESPSDFFESIGPAMLWNSVRTLAKQHVLLLTDKSLPTLSSESAGPKSTPKTPDVPAKTPNQRKAKRKARR
jgi:hypothetical protein